MHDEFKNLHWDVPEHQDAAQKSWFTWVFYWVSHSITESQTDLQNFKKYIFNAQVLFHSVVQIIKGGSLIRKHLSLGFQ